MFFRQFKDRYTLKERQNIANQVRKKYPDRFPIIIDRLSKSHLSQISKHKYLVPSDMTLGLFLLELRKHISNSQTRVILLFVNNKLLSVSAKFNQIYDKYKEDDEFLYITYCEENSGKCILL